MNLLEKATTLETWCGAEIRCGHCQARMIIDSSDIRHRSLHRSVDEYYVVCPECPSTIGMTGEYYGLISDHMRVLIRERDDLKKRTEPKGEQ